MPYIGRYFSDLWVRKNVLHQSEEEIAEMMDEMGEEKVPMMAPTPEGMDKAPAPIANRPDTQNDTQTQQTTDTTGISPSASAAHESNTRKSSKSRRIRLF
jgi:hypothetical protein